MSARKKGDRAPFGFTVVEVMVAVMLLAVAVVSIFGAQFAAVATADYSKYVTQAIQLSRCRMNELELQFQIDDGFEQGDVSGSGQCCEIVDDETEVEAFKCSWEIKTIDLPDVTQMIAAAGADGGVADDMMGGGLGDMADEFDAMGMVAAIAPMITDLLREAIRRVTVKVEWQQGANQRQVEVTQYVVHPTQGPLELMQQAAAMDQLADDALLGPGAAPGAPRGGGVNPDGSGGKSGER
jgi:hypothetical protein